MALIVEIGSVQANSYTSVVDADAYIATRLYTTNWPSSATPEGIAQKEKALIWAARIIDTHIKWDGTRQYEYQARAWPRCNACDSDGWLIRIDTVPEQIKWAQVELAYELLSNDRITEPDTKGIKKIKIEGAIEVIFDKTDRSVQLTGYILSLVQQFGEYIGMDDINSSATMVNLIRA
jgi:hypothetical protein